MILGMDKASTNPTTLVNTYLGKTVRGYLKPGVTRLMGEINQPNIIYIHSYESIFTGQGDKNRQYK